MIGQTYQNKKNTFFIEKKLKNKLPNSIITFFLMMHFIYGFNFGFTEVLNKKIRRFCELISLLVCLYSIIILLCFTLIFLQEWGIEAYMGLLLLVQYCGHIIILYFAKYKVYNFITDIRSIDRDIAYSKEHKIGLFICIVSGSFLVFVLTLPVVVCTYQTFECSFVNNLVVAIYHIPISGLDAMVLVQLTVNFYTYYSAIYLVGLVGSEKVTLIRKQFLRISECCEKFGGLYGNLVVMELLIHLPKYLVLICNVIYNFKENEMWKIYLFQLWYSILILLQMSAPAVVVEGIKKQMETFKFQLYTRLMEEKDIEKHLELSSLLHYMEQKPLYSKAWRVIPTDINLVVALFSFVPTYVIVIIQFMHIY